MNPLHRKVLDQHRKALVQDLILTEDFRAELRQSDLFPEGMIDLIMAERIRGERVLKMLELLPTRGPTAFDTFQSILEKDYPWLQKGLQEDLDKEIAAQQQHVRCSSDHDHENHVVRSRASSFLHKKFGQSRKISEKDKRAIEKWLSDCVQEERTLWKQKLENQARSNARSTEKGMEDISSQIEILNLKLEMCLFDSTQTGEEDEETAVKSKLHRNLKPEDAILYLDQNINNVREKLRSLSTDQERCLQVALVDINPGEVGAARVNPSSSTSVYKEVVRMKRYYEKKIQDILTEKEAVECLQKEKIEELMADNLDMIEARNKQMDETRNNQKEMFSLQMKKGKLEERIQRLEATIREQTKTIENMKSHLNSTQRHKDKPLSNQSNWQIMRGQRGTLASQRTKRRILSKVNSTYLTETTKPLNKTTKE
ncbi:rootletin-like [Liolophura sinensis]|uniref:rootletin-like n=1 Tax=Liolophura sinensis TaxID=3198878 RepID=UPI00315946E1